jgi:Pectate lyase superfamily protein/MBG domain (YGX type)/SprB repeat
MKNFSVKTILLILFTSIFCKINAQQTYFPQSNVAWKNLKTDYGAYGDGIHDDTEAFRTAVRTYLNPYNSLVAIFIPKGTYLVSDSVQSLMGYYDCCLILQGESRDSTIIKIKDNAPNFQDKYNPRPFLKTRGGNQAFGNYILNLTINTGLSNEGAVAFDYVTSNYGAIRNVNITSPDGSGYCGLRMEQNWPGPGIIKNVNIQGFDYGIRVATCEYSMTFEDITLTNQAIYGLYNSCNTLSIRHLTSNNSVPAIRNQGRVILIDSELKGGNISNSAINSSEFLFARNIKTEGYGTSIINGTQTVSAAYVSEFRNIENYSTFPNDNKSLDLPIEETPEYFNNNPNDWADVTTYGANPTNPVYANVNATAGIQAALNSGKKVVYFGKIGDNNTGYCVDADIHVPASVEMITGLNLSKIFFFNNSKIIIDSFSTKPLFIESFKSGMKLLNNSKRTVVIKSTAIQYNNTIRNTNGKVFIEDMVEAFTPQFPVRMWARQLNPEVQPENEKDIDNIGGKFWILGLKTEGRAVIANTTNGGATEILGALVYPSSTFSGNNQPAFTVQNAALNIVGLTMISYIPNGWYGIAVNESQNGVSKTLRSDTIWSNSPYQFGFYKSSVANSCLALPIVSITGTNPICVEATNTLSPSIGGTWVSNSPVVASVVSATGVVTGISTGTATFTFTSNISPICSNTTLPITVNSPPTVTSNPSNSSIIYGANTTFSVASTSYTSQTYQWQVSINSGSSWTDVGDGIYTNETTPTLTITKPSVVMNSYQYRCVITNPCGNTNSEGAILSVVQRPITIVADAKTKVYGSTDPALTVQITSGSIVSGDSATATLSRTMGENIGTYTISKGTFTYGGNYLETYLGGNLTITKKALAITANNRNKCEGTTATFTGTEFTLVGLVNGDSITNVTLSSTGSVLSATKSSPGPTYPILISAATGNGLNNYNISYVSGTLTIISPSLLFESTLPLCFGYLGSVILQASSGSSSGNTFTSTPNTNVTIVGNTLTAPAGVYQITVTDGVGCTKSETLTISQPIQIAGSSAKKSYNGSDLSCATANDGQITVTATGGTGTKQYSIDNLAYQSSNIFTGLSAGVHTLKVKDANGCEVSLSSDTITAPTAVVAGSASSNQTDVSCFEGNNGAINLSVSSATGGTGSKTYSYVWTKIGGGFSASTEDITGLYAGVYSVLITATDVNLCTATTGLTVTINQPTTTLSAIATGTNVKCFGGLTGSATVTATGGTAPYTYLWDNVSASTTATITGLAGGTYKATVTDSKGCVITANYVVTKPSSALSATTSQVNVLCKGGATGTAAVLATGGTIGTGYTYSWNTSPVQTTIIATGLVAGNYTVTVTDANGCTFSPTAVVISEPTAVTSITASSTSPICELSSLNLASTPTSSTGGLTYSWAGPNTFTSTSASISISNAQTVNAGTYTITVTDANNCVASATANVIINTIPTVTVTSVDTLCNGSTISLTATGGGTYQWSGPNSFTSTSTNVSIANATVANSGTYVVKGTNANGCTASAVRTITVNPAVSIPTTQSYANLPVGGSITLTATGCLGTLLWFKSADNSSISMPVSPTTITSYYAKCEVTISGITCVSAKSANLVVIVGAIISIKTGGAWEDPTTWDANRVPLTTDEVLIDSNHNVIITTMNAVAKKVHYKNNGTITLGNSAAKLTISGL